MLKECDGEMIHTYPLRMTAIISKNNDVLQFNFMHFSFPFYWIFEGKVDTILIKK